MNQKPPARPSRRRPRHNNRKGLPFFYASFFMLVLAVIYIAGGEYLFPENENGDVLLPIENEIIVSFLDVGQGDSIVIHSADNAILIDGGEYQSRRAVTDYLREARIDRLDYVIATHPHSDHIGGLVTVLRDFDIGCVVMPDAINNTDTFENFLSAIENNNHEVIIPVHGERITAGIIEMTVISRPSGNHINNASIVLRMEYGGTSFLFTGDAETASEQWMLENNGNVSANVLKVGHHGSDTSTGEAFLNAVNPTAAIISVGDGNRYNHPHPETVSRLEARGITVYRTDHHGTIRMITNGHTVYFP